MLRLKSKCFNNVLFFFFLGKLDNFVKSKSNSSTTLQPTNNAIVVVKKDKKDKKRKFEQSKVNVKSNNDKEESSSSSSSDDESSNISPLQKKIRLVYKTAVKNNKQDHDNDFLLNNFGMSLCATLSLLVICV